MSSDVKNSGQNCVGWIEFSSSRYGGAWYNRQSQKAIAKHFDLELISLEAKHLKKHRYLKFFELFYYLLQIKGEKSLWIRDFYSVLSLSKKKTKGKDLALIFHIDFLKFPLLSKIPLFLLEKLFFYRQLKKTDAILTISQYWKDYFLQKGYKNVYKIYCGFNLNDFSVSDQAVLDFKNKYHLNSKPIIYLGNCQKAKGVVDAWQALKSLDVHLVTSGKRHVNIPALNLDLDHKEYLALLKASSVVVTMSTFKEGWCITAHEAMLLKTPVIGSGQGGMQELLEGGGQIICKDFSNLKKQVEDLLKDSGKRKILGEKGFNFAKNFTEEKFEQDWASLIKNVINLELNEQD